MNNLKDAKVKDIAIADMARSMSGALSECEAEEIFLRQSGDEAYKEQLLRTAEMVSDLDRLADSAVIRSIKCEAVRRRYSPRAVAASILIVMAAGLAYFFQGVDQAEPQKIDRYVTRVGEQKTVTLSDSSTVYLNTNSELLVLMADDARKLTLKRGEAYFDVAMDSTRPFSVEVGDQSVTVLGTAFNIYREPDLVSVAVTEGALVVHDSGEDLSSLRNVAFSDVSSGVHKVSGRYRLQAGQQVAIDTDLDTLAFVEYKEAGGWRTGQLLFSNTSLADVVKELNRYSSKKILIEDESIMGLSISASFKVDRINTAIRGIELTHDIKVKNFSDRIVIVGHSGHR